MGNCVDSKDIDLHPSTHMMDKNPGKGHQEFSYILISSSDDRKPGIESTRDGINERTEKLDTHFSTGTSEGAGSKGIASKKIQLYGQSSSNFHKSYIEFN